jgi:hypothetical protein
MKYKKPKTLNFDSEIIDTRSALGAYISITEREPINLIYKGENVHLDDILRSEMSPGNGFKKGVLPKHINNIYTTLNDDKEQIIISYNGKLNHKTEKEHWENKGYQTRPIKQSMEVINSNGNIVATYGRNRVCIEQDCLDQFIYNMR